MSLPDLTDAVLDELLKLDAEASPAPWRHHNDDTIVDCNGKHTDGEGGNYCPKYPDELANASIIIQSRNNLAALVAEVRRGREERAWISVSDRLPSRFESVLLTYKTRNGPRVGEGYQALKTMWQLTSAEQPFENNADVTHWRPLPAAALSPERTAPDGK